MVVVVLMARVVMHVVIVAIVLVGNLSWPGTCVLNVPSEVSCVLFLSKIRHEFPGYVYIGHARVHVQGHVHNCVPNLVFRTWRTRRQVQLSLYFKVKILHFVFWCYCR